MRFMSSGTTLGNSEMKTTWHQHRPKRIFLLRHAESLGNIDETAYSRIPDSLMPITEKGWEQAQDAGALLQQVIQNERVNFFVSPYLRAQQTYEGIMMKLDGPTRGGRHYWREEPRLREQDFGNLQNAEAIKRCQQERGKFGTFYYRFPQGESGADVYDRVSSFMETLHREFDKPDSPANFALVTHGITLRLFLMRYFHWTVNHFQRLRNPDNCQILLMEKQPSGRYLLADHPLLNQHKLKVKDEPTLDSPRERVYHPDVQSLPTRASRPQQTQHHPPPHPHPYQTIQTGSKKKK